MDAPYYNGPPQDDGDPLGDWPDLDIDWDELEWDARQCPIEIVAQEEPEAHGNLD